MHNKPKLYINKQKNEVRNRSQSFVDVSGLLCEFCLPDEADVRLGITGGGPCDLVSAFGEFPLVVGNGGGTSRMGEGRTTGSDGPLLGE